MKRTLALLLLVTAGCADPSSKAPVHPTRESCGKREMFLSTDKYQNEKWFPVVTKTRVKCLQHIPPMLTPGSIVAANEDDTVMVYSHVEASTRSQWDSSGEVGYPRSGKD